MYLSGLREAGAACNQSPIASELTTRQYTFPNVSCVLFFLSQVGSSPGRLIEIQSELKRLQAITPSSDPLEAEVQAGR